MLDFILALCTILGGITAAVIIGKGLIGAFSKVNYFWGYFVTKLDNIVSFKKIKRAAVEFDIVTPLNELINDISNELPNSWVKPVSFKWVRKESKEHFIKDGKIVLRIRPKEHQENNFLTAILYYFKGIIFPGTKDIIPKIIQNSSSLYLAQRTVAKRSEKLEDIFEEEYLNPTIKKNAEISEYIEKFQQLDCGGLYTSTYFREMQEFAKISRLTEMRDKIIDESDEIIDHCLAFINHIRLPKKQKKKLRESDFDTEKIFTHSGRAFKFSFLAVARPHHFGASDYIYRVEKKIENGADRIYVVGAGNEVTFTNDVIDTLQEKVKGIKLIHRFNQYRDYRGDYGGIGAVFAVVK